MLNPIKSLFSYLNKNANSVKSNEVNMTDEVNQSPDNEGDNFDDPLTDPLALDIEVELNDASEHHVEDIENVIESSSISTSIVEEIIFVDIETLKHRGDEVNVEIDDEEEEEDDDDVDEDDNNEKEKSNLNPKETENYVKKSDINGNDRHPTTNTTNPSLNSACKSLKNESGTSVAATERQTPSLSYIESNGKSDKESDKSNTLDKSADNSSVISVISSEPENDEITDTSELRSDGSDSGLGSDILRSVSAIEKNLKLLTPAKSSLKRRSNETLHNDSSESKKPRHSINFSDITIFYFPRCQGFSCVPTQGGSSLGMTSKHAYKKTFSLAEHAIEQRRLHRLKMAGELNESTSSSDESKSDDEISENSFSEGDTEAYGFLQPVTARQRRAILKAAGVKKIDSMEKDECRQLRLSREVCGCTCRGYCDPDTCECSQAGIKCQVDRLKPHEFPCGCTRDGCGNVNGRVEFNPARVKTHFIHTIMRLELEKRQEMSEDSSATSSSVIQNHPKWWSQMRMQQTNVNSPNQSSNCNFSNYSTPSATTTQYASSSKVSLAMTSPNLVTQESIDLHYAYRDDYINNPINPDTSSFSTNSSNGSDYYSNFSYLSNTSTTPNSHYQAGYQTQQQQQHLPYYTSDCQYSNYSATNGSNRYHLKNDTSLDINGFYPTMHSGSLSNSNQQQSRINYQQIQQNGNEQQQQQLPTIESFTTSLNQSTTTSLNTASVAQGISPNSNVVVDTTANSQESNENLCEIIKKSIVETVTA